MPAVSVKQARYFRWLEHAPEAAGERKKSGMSRSKMHDFAATPNAGLPEHKADGGMTNTAFQQTSSVRGSKRPAWMERASQMADGRPLPDGLNHGKPAPVYRVRAAKVTATPMMADGDSGHWMEDAFAHNKGGLHRATHTPEGEKIPNAKMQKALNSTDLHTKRMALAAHNAKK